MKRIHWAALAVVALSSLPYLALTIWVGYGQTVSLIHHSLAVLAAAVLLTARGWWSEVGLSGRSRWCHLHLAALPLVAVAWAFPGTGDVTVRQFLPYGVLALLLALEREIWFRGILFRALAPAYGSRRTVTLTALLFGLSQMVDLLAGAAPGVTLVKALVSVFFGYVLGALRLRTRSLWPGIVVATLFYGTIFLRRLQDSGEMLPVSQERLSLQIFLAVLVVGCARFWMRRVDEVGVERKTA